MRCRRWEKKISDYINNALEREERAQVEEHLQSCARCRELLNAMKRSDALARRILEEDITQEALADYWPRLRSKILGEDKQASAPLFGPVFLWKRWPAMLTVAGIILLALAGAGLFWKVKTLQSELRKSRKETGERLAKLAHGGRLRAEGYLAGNVVLTGSIPKDLSLFRGLQESFSESIVWVVLDGERIDLGLSKAKDEELIDPSQPLVFLDFLILKEDARLRGRLVSSPRIIVRNGQEVNAAFKATREAGLTYRLRCQPRADGGKKVLLEIELILQKTGAEMAGEPRLSRLSADISVEPGKTAVLGSVLLGEELYRVEVMATIEKPALPPSLPKADEKI